MNPPSPLFDSRSSRHFLRVAVLGAVAALSAGCSSKPLADVTFEEFQDQCKSVAEFYQKKVASLDKDAINFGMCLLNGIDSDSPNSAEACKALETTCKDQDSGPSITVTIEASSCDEAKLKPEYESFVKAAENCDVTWSDYVGCMDDIRDAKYSMMQAVSKLKSCSDSLPAEPSMPSSCQKLSSNCPALLTFGGGSFDGYDDYDKE